MSEAGMFLMLLVVVLASIALGFIVGIILTTAAFSNKEGAKK